MRIVVPFKMPQRDWKGSNVSDRGRFINTLLQRRARGGRPLGTVSTVSPARETVETVLNSREPLVTPLKCGVNESQLRRRADGFGGLSDSGFTMVEIAI